MHFLHAMLPDEPEERAKGPFSVTPRLAKGAPEGGTVHRHVIKGSEREQGKPDWGGPQPGLSRESRARVERLEVVIQDRGKRAKVIRWAGGPYVFQREGGAASASLSKGEAPVPGVSNWESRENLFVKKFLQANRDINRPNEGDMFNRVEVGREESGHMGRPEGRERCELRAEEWGRGRSHYHISEEG